MQSPFLSSVHPKEARSFKQAVLCHADGDNLFILSSERVGNPIRLALRLNHRSIRTPRFRVESSILLKPLWGREYLLGTSKWEDYRGW